MNAWQSQLRLPHRRMALALVAALAAVLVLGVSTTTLVRAQLAKVTHYVSPEEKDLTHLPPTKQAVVQRAVQQQATVEAQAALRPTPGAKGSPTPLPPGTLPEPPRGIIQEGQAPFSSRDVTVWNQWQDQLDGQWVQAYAGALGTDPAQGVVLVTGGAHGGRFLTPSKSGAVHFTAANGTRLTLESAQGASFVLDVAAGTFNAGP